MTLIKKNMILLLILFDLDNMIKEVSLIERQIWPHLVKGRFLAKSKIRKPARLSVEVLKRIFEEISILKYFQKILSKTEISQKCGIPEIINSFKGVKENPSSYKQKS